MRQAVFMGVVIAALAWPLTPLRAAESVSGHVDAAKAAHAKGDMARAATELEAALAELHARLAKALTEFLPPSLPSWQAEMAETQGLAGAGGGLAVSRAYSRDDSSVNATLILDSPAVVGAVALFTANAPAQPNVRRLKIGAEDAILRWDAANRAGEVTMVLGGRVLLQIEGDNLGSSDPLVDAAKGWNLTGIRKYLGL